MAVLPYGVGVFPTYGAWRSFLAKNNNAVLYLQYHIFKQEQLYTPIIWRAFDHGPISSIGYIDMSLKIRRVGVLPHVTIDNYIVALK